MVKATSLSEDLNFVKEFEELRLKQKLLIGSLNKKNSSEMNNYLLDINSKLDFLVKIFKEANKSDDGNDLTTLINSKFLELSEKIDESNKTLDEKLDNFESKLNKTEEFIEKNIKKEEDTNVSLPPPKFIVDEKNFDEISNFSKNSFKGDEVKNNDSVKVDSENEVKKKKKWF